MRTLVLGGTRFMGYFLVHRLLAAGHRVTLLNRGQTPDPFGDRVHRIRADRAAADLPAALGALDFDAAVDFTAYTERDARGIVQALGTGRVGHYVLISTGQVYLVREGCPRPSSEPDYEGPLLPEPEDPEDRAAWAYGMGKRACEDVLGEAWDTARFPATRLRLPMVVGPRDPKRRLQAYIARMLDGAPLLLPDGGAHRVRPAFVLDVVDAILKILVTPWTAGHAYNICQTETLSLLDYLQLAAEAAGAFPRFLDLPSAAITAAGLDPVAISPLAGRWMSLLDPARAASELDLHPRPAERAVEITVASWLAHPTEEPPPGYARRGEEIALIEATLAAETEAGGAQTSS